tara:strand:+ start:114 stop:1910 length:1797 start_codon:yes stop_codon:yes gene_type:complete
MPLIEMTSDLTSLKFGRDRRGGGNSGQPYFTKDIPGRLESIDQRNSVLGTDFLIRGGALSAVNVLEDEQRLGKFLTDFKSPNGALFIAKQNLLSLQNPKTGAGPIRGYTPAKTLAQVAVNPLGIHLSPIINDENKYEFKTKNIYNTNQLGVENKNKLLLLYETNIISPTATSIGAAPDVTQLLNSLSNTSAETGLNAFSENLKTFGISEDPNILLQYRGGPNSVIGGRTIIRKDSKFNTSQGLERNSKFTADVNKFLVYTPDLIINKTVIGNVGSTGFGGAGIANFQSDLLDPADTGVPEIRRKQLIGEPTDYNTFNRSKTYGEGDPGKKKPEGDRSVYYTTNLRSEALTNKTIQDTYTPDSINAVPLYSTSEISAKKEDGYTDIIKFNIGVIDLNSAGLSNPPKTNWIHLRAYINSFADNYGADWQSFKYMGRGNSFYKYNGFTRTISMGFDVAIHSKYEQGFVYDKLNYLASLTAPNYSDGGFMRGNIIKLTVGDYLNNQFGILNGLNFSIPDDSTWDIGRDLDGKEDANSLQLPHRITVGNFAFTPIHNFVEDTVKTSYIEGALNTPGSNYISLGNNAEGYETTFSQRKNINNTK